MSRDVIVVDTETTGLNPLRHDACEVGWVPLVGGRLSGWFVPPHSTKRADATALEINRYVERITGSPLDLDYAQTGELHTALTGNTLAGSNPAFDALFLNKLFADAGLPPSPWHHRLLDLSAYAAGVLGLPVSELEGLDKVARRLNLPVDDTAAHTAYGDALLTARCFVELGARRSEESAA